MDFAFKTIAEFNDYFKDEKTCYEFLETQVWGGVGAAICPHCASAKKPYTVKARGKFTDIPSYRCSERACGLPFTVRTGSIFEGSKVELRKWLQASYEISISKKGISSIELASRIGVSQKTAWFINHRLRTMLTETNPEILVGEVEVDETYYSGVNKNRHKNKKVEGTGMVAKSPMVGLLQRDGKVILKVLGKGQATGENIRPIVRKHVSTDAMLYTDGFGGYKALSKEYKEHSSVDHSGGEYVRGKVHTNSIEGFWSILKRGIVGTFHVVSHQHLQRYCDEFAHRYNTRSLTPVERFTESIKGASQKRLKYRDLTPNQPKIKATI